MVRMEYEFNLEGENPLDLIKDWSTVHGGRIVHYEEGDTSHMVQIEFLDLETAKQSLISYKGSDVDIDRYIVQ